MLKKLDKINNMYDFVKLPKNHRDCKLSEIPDNLEYKKIIEEWFHNILDKIDNGDCLYLYGNYGTGKSGAAAILLKAALAYASFGIWANFKDLQNWSYSPEKHMFSDHVTMMERLRDVPILVIDEMEIKKSREWTLDIFDNLIRNRTQDVKSTIITSNHSPSFIKNTECTKSLSNIMREKFIPVKVEGKFFR